MATTLTRAGLVEGARFTLRIGAIDGNGVCEYFSFAPSAGTLTWLKAQPGFPEPIRPTGARGSDRWNVEELDEWRMKHALRASAGVPNGKWADDDPRRVRATERAAARAAKPTRRSSAETGERLQ